MVRLYGLDEAGIMQYKCTVLVTTLLFGNNQVIKRAETFWS